MAKAWPKRKTLINHLQKQSFADVLKNYANFTGKHLFRSIF